MQASEIAEGHVVAETPGTKLQRSRVAIIRANQIKQWLDPPCFLPNKRLLCGLKTCEWRTRVLSFGCCLEMLRPMT